MRGAGLLVLILALGAACLSPEGRAAAAGGGENAPPPASPPASQSVKVPGDRQPLILEPFFLLRGEGPRLRLERVLVVLELAFAASGGHIEVTGPIFRKSLYEMLQGDQPEGAITSQVRSQVNQVLGAEAVLAVHITRSILIVR